MNTIKELNDALNNIAAVMTDKGITSPMPEITHVQGGRVNGWLHATGLIGGETCVNFSGDNTKSVIADMLAHITALPSAEEKAECRRCGDDVTVWAEHADGMLVEMTDAAKAIARGRAGSEIPEWLLSEDERDLAERDALLTASHERLERHDWGQV